MTDPIRAEAIRTLYAQIRTMFAATLVITAYMAATAAPFTDWQPIAIWATVVLLNQGLRLLLVRAFNRAAAPDSDLDRWARYYTAQQGLTGVIWAASMVLFAHPDQPVTIALTLSCLYSIASGSVPPGAYHPPALFALILPLYATILVWLLLPGSLAYALVGVASALYGLTMLSLCRVQARSVREGIRIRFENRALVEALTVQKAEAEKARQAAESASLAKSQFLAAASHDLRQPLYALSLFSTSLGTLKLDHDGRAVVNNIQESIAAMEALFVGLLDISRLDAGVVQPQVTAVSIDAIFDRLSQYFRPIAMERGIDLRLRSDGEWVLSDATLLEQVLSNLVSNALRYTRKGAVLVAARRRGDDLRLEVWDTGIGIEEADRQRIFEEFVQVSNSERDRRRGLGLGLAIAQRSVALIGGEISVASRPGRGSRFAFMQPRTESPMETQRQTSVVRGLPRFTASRDLPVLIVDDDRDVRAALGDLLTRWNVRFDLAIDAQDALRGIDGGARYGLVLADYRLPGAMNGLDLVAAIAQRHERPLPQFALVTGDFSRDLISAAQARDIPLFHKPLKPSDLRLILGIEESVGVVA